MSKLEKLLAANKIWAAKMKETDAQFFERLSDLQTPKFLWIGCSDSRITPDASTELLPGELFVHRNIANLVVHTDMNCLSVMQFAVEVLRVEHIIVCGHYGCGGVKAALENTRLGLIDNWLRHIQDVGRDYRIELEAAASPDARLDKLCEINVIEQVLNAGQTTVMQDAWLRGQTVSIHGWIYHITDGIFQDLQVTLDNLEDLNDLGLKMIERQKGEQKR
ncbi:MAG: carbonate dehydratase [Acidobacteriota bacterium]|nr:carbonate dehydratase [Acidobacteriota bacterium]